MQFQEQTNWSQMKLPFSLEVAERTNESCFDKICAAMQCPHHVVLLLHIDSPRRPSNDCNSEGVR